VVVVVVVVVESADGASGISCTNWYECIEMSGCWMIGAEDII
jgi:hypothetical protein